ncbi:condensation domain-containing protein, partial [Chitinophaga varians]|uniref:condensation domain-containing protein n=1 Tax=Chitinophaga varians TaxID=2202339 RepID=UPI0019A5756E
EIREAVVCLREDDRGAYLAAYYISTEEITATQLKQHLSGRLPEYMHPSYYIHLTAFPLLLSGKVDRKQLPAPELPSGGYFRPATSETEQRLAGIWSDVLHIDKDKISIDQNFFDLGGHSLKAVQLIDGIQRVLGTSLRLRDIFSHTTIEEQALLTGNPNISSLQDIPRAPQQEYYRVSPAQQKLFYEQWANENTTAYNVVTAVEIMGEVDRDKLEHSFQVLIDRHDMLRASFDLSEEGVIQYIHQHVPFRLTLLDADQYTSRQEAFDAFLKPFDLSAAPLIRCGLYGNILFIDIHHIVCDGIALNVLTNEFRQIYIGRSLPSTGLRYVDYVMWKLDNRQLEQQRQFWTQKLAGELPVLELPVINSGVVADRYTASHMLLEITGEQYHQLKKYTTDNQVSDFMLLLSVFDVLLAKITGQTDIIVCTDVVGRTHTALKEVVGTFVNLLPLRIQIGKDATFSNVLQDVKSGLLEVFDHQDVHMEEILPMLLQQDRLPEKLFRVHFSFANYQDSHHRYDVLNMVPLQQRLKASTQYEFKVEAAEKEDSMQLYFIFSKALYEEQTIALMVQYYRNILTAVLDNPAMKLSTIVPE